MFIVIEYGMPSVAESLDIGNRMNTLAAMAETWKQCYAFSPNVRYVGEPSQSIYFGWFRRILAHTIYNPITDITREWRESGGYEMSEIFDLVERGLENDDDIIQQWFGADDVMRPESTLGRIVSKICLAILRMTLCRHCPASGYMNAACAPYE